MALEGYETTTDCKRIAAVNKITPRRHFKLSKGLKQCHTCTRTCYLCFFSLKPDQFMKKNPHLIIITTPPPPSLFIEDKNYKQQNLFQVLVLDLYQNAMSKED